jgi:hypothetical protein
VALSKEMDLLASPKADIAIADYLDLYSAMVHLPIPRFG